MSPRDPGELRPVDGVGRGERLVPVQRSRDADRRPDEREQRRRKPRPPAPAREPAEGRVDIRA